MLEFPKNKVVFMEILDFILIAIFVFLMIVLVIGFNHQMMQKNKEREERFKKYKKGEQNE
ncbi:hypothetical protein ABZL51_000913 [Campylobacter jejuni]|uniref:Uncharacterized protein n=1 Tax=Campylobacter jejuni TaxID=197 RepID=A0A624F3E8_CAMJU|nr:MULTISPECIES: hypothetical protein [Campylobacter]EAI3413634.1 hypothetical protein [Campylobacter jejuni]EAL4710214.1 hypothetical protein [Campylobacter jejuni]EBH4141992.1 hypothetical protein [Campylobacter jejuni]ECL0300128.1 hypothetical protein [Campylobacter jejuni]ECL2827301.1 hypothetical protein [Campylobacter jejuni]